MITEEESDITSESSEGRAELGHITQFSMDTLQFSQGMMRVLCSYGSQAFNEVVEFFLGKRPGEGLCVKADPQNLAGSGAVKSFGASWVIVSCSDVE